MKDPKMQASRPAGLAAVRQALGYTACWFQLRCYYVFIQWLDVGLSKAKARGGMG